MTYCFIYHNSCNYGDFVEDVFDIQLSYELCDECNKQIKEATKYNGSYLNVIREHYYYKEYSFNNETNNKIINNIYPKYPYEIELCEDCIYYKTERDTIVTTNKAINSRKIFNPINNKYCYVNKKDYKKYEYYFDKLFEKNIEFTLYRYEYCD